MKADLHCHSTCSDGVLSPTELIERAIEREVEVLALTDHDTTAGIAEARRHTQGSNLELITGIELSISEDAGATQFHMLGYGFDPEHPELAAALDQVESARVGRAAQTVELLAGLGIELDLDALLERAGSGTVGRPHIAAALVERGACSSQSEAFTRYLRRGRPAFVPSPGLSAGRALALLHAAGGVASLAHPFLSSGVASLGIEKFVGRLVAQGLDAIEAHHPKHKKNQRQRLVQLAKRYGLLVTGGTDFHGTPNQDTPLGSVGIGPEPYARLRERIGSVNSSDRATTMA